MMKYNSKINKELFSFLFDALCWCWLIRIWSTTTTKSSNLVNKSLFVLKTTFSTSGFLLAFFLFCNLGKKRFCILFHKIFFDITFGVWPFTLPARANEPWTLPPNNLTVASSVEPDTRPNCSTVCSSFNGVPL